MFCSAGGFSFILSGLVYFVDRNVLRLNGRSAVMTFLFYWISQLLMEFVLMISSLLIVYSDDYMSSDLRVIRHG